MLLRFEEISNNAWPALQTIQYDGWLIRLANGVTKRSNSVSMLYPSSLDPMIKIGFCEKIYHSQHITPCFKVTELSSPAGIDIMLENEGYFIHSTISFQTLDLLPATNQTVSLVHHPQLMNDSGKSGYIHGFPSLEVKIQAQESPDWIDEFIRMNGFDTDRKPTYLAIMRQMITPKCVISLVFNGTIIGVGLGILDDACVGLFDIVIDPGFRRNGLGELLVNRILDWGYRQGAVTAYLQVLSDNQPALRLYKKSGFTEKYRYWYRMKS